MVLWGQTISAADIQTEQTLCKGAFANGCHGESSLHVTLWRPVFIPEMMMC